MADVPVAFRDLVNFYVFIYLFILHKMGETEKEATVQNFMGLFRTV